MMRWSRIAPRLALGVAIALAGCAHMRPAASGKTLKFCGRDYGDRIHWSSVPAWFTPKDCADLNADALTSDLYLGCYTRAEGLTHGGGDLAPPASRACRW